MQHPFIDPEEVKKQSLEEIQKKMYDITGKLTYAYRVQNGPLIQQLHMALDSYRSIYFQKMDDLYKKQNIQDKIKIDSSKQ